MANDKTELVDDRPKQESLIKRPERPERESQVDRGASDELVDDRNELDEMFRDTQHPRPWEGISALADAGLLTERQAEVYVRRRIELEDADEIAEDLGIARSTMNDHLGRAKQLIRQAEKSVHALRQYRAPPMPDECGECGESLGGRFAKDDDGNPLCLDCAGVDRSEIP